MHDESDLYTVFRIDLPARSGHIVGGGPCGDGRGQNWGRPVAATMEGFPGIIPPTRVTTMPSQHRESEYEATLKAAEDAFNADDYELAADGFQRILELAERDKLGDEYVADSLEGLATARSLADESAEVQAIEHRASEIRDRLLAEKEASVPPGHAAIAECLDRCAFHRLRQGNKSEAIQLFERALHIRKGVLGEVHFDVANSITILAGAYSFRDHHNVRTAELWKDAVEILERLFDKPETRTYGVVISLTGNLDNLAMRAYEQDEFDTAESLFRRVVEVNSAFFGPEGCVQPLNAPAFARVLMHRGGFDEAEGVLKVPHSDAHLATERKRTLMGFCCKPPDNTRMPNQ